jgi:ribosome biogenesis protein SSF1/2
MRNLMHPYTASNLKERKFNSMKDYIRAAGQFGVSHMMLIS